MRPVRHMMEIAEIAGKRRTDIIQVSRMHDHQIKNDEDSLACSDGLGSGQSLRLFGSASPTMPVSSQIRRFQRDIGHSVDRNDIGRYDIVFLFSRYYIIRYC